MAATASILLLIVVGLFAFVGWIANEISKASAKRRRAVEFRQAAKKKFGNRNINRQKSLEARNEDIIQGHIAKLQHGYQRSYYIENAVRDCIQDIAQAEGNLAMAPNYKYLSRWVNGATPEYRSLSEALLTRFREVKRKIDEDTRAKEALERQAKSARIKLAYAELINQFYEITERKVSTVDDYGDENWDVLDKEIEILIQKIAKRERVSEGQIKHWKKFSFSMPAEFQELSDYLRQGFKEYHEDRRKRPLQEEDYSQMTGIEFENFLVKLLQQNGFSDIRGTPATGDQGADLIANRDGKTIVIQAKRYTGSVGNKAVQEAASAVSFYGADEGWVITNSTFTKAAKELAQKTKITLIDGFALSRFAEKYGAEWG